MRDGGGGKYTSHIPLDNASLPVFSIVPLSVYPNIQEFLNFTNFSKVLFSIL